MKCSSFVKNRNSFVHSVRSQLGEVGAGAEEAPGDEKEAEPLEPPAQIKSARDDSKRGRSGKVI